MSTTEFLCLRGNLQNLCPTERLSILCWMTGAGWHKAGPDQQLPPHVAWNQVSDAERRSLDGSASAENISRGQQQGPMRSNSYKLPQGIPCHTCQDGCCQPAGHVRDYHGCTCFKVAVLHSCLSFLIFLEQNDCLLTGHC